MDTFQHSPLHGPRNIRLCELGPARLDSAPLVCKLYEFPIEQTPHYEALSYHCGFTYPPASVTCAGRRLDITQNCAAALRRLRLEKEPRILWVDSICISQVDKVEKSHQIQLMTQIYQKASEVWIWVGDGNSRADTYVRTLSHLADFGDTLNFNPNAERLPNGNFDLSGSGLKVAAHLISAAIMYGIVKPLMFLCMRLPKSQGWPTAVDQSFTLDFFSRAVFDRMWCFQEAAVASRIRLLCGDATAEWEALMKNIQFYQTKSPVKAETMHATFARKIIFQDILRDFIHPKPGQSPRPWPSVTALLDNTRFRGAAEPRDKVYALFGIFHMMGLAPPLPDYNKPVWQVYEEITLLAITQSRNTDILYQITGFQNQYHLPSWVPDFSDTQAPVTLILPAFQASRNSAVQWRLNERNNGLCLSGKAIDRVRSITAMMRFINSPSQARDKVLTAGEKTAAFGIFKQWQTLVQSLPNYSNGRTPSEMFGLILASSCNTFEKVKPAKIVRVFNDWYSALAQADRYENSPFTETGIENLIHTIESVPLQGAEQIEFAHQHAAASLLLLAAGGVSVQHRIRALHYWMCLCLRGKALFVTKGGYLGLAPASVLTGDEVFLLSGLKTPFVGRFLAQEDGSGSLKLLCPAFVAGMMDGECWAESERLHEFMFM